MPLNFRMLCYPAMITGTKYISLKYKWMLVWGIHWMVKTEEHLFPYSFIHSFTHFYTHSLTHTCFHNLFKYLLQNVLSSHYMLRTRTAEVNKTTLQRFVLKWEFIHLFNQCLLSEVLCSPSLFSCVQLFAILWIVACQVPLSMGFSRQEYWSGLPFPPPGDLPDPGIEPLSLASPALAGRFLTTSTTGEVPSDREVINMIFQTRGQQTTAHRPNQTLHLFYLNTPTPVCLHTINGGGDSSEPRVTVLSGYAEELSWDVKVRISQKRGFQKSLMKLRKVQSP